MTRLELNLIQSLLQVLKTAYPETQWQPWILNEEPKDYWNNLDNVRAYFNWHGEKLELNNPNDWYKKSLVDILKWRGKELLSTIFGNSPLLAMRAIYPEYEWNEWLFNQEPVGYWNDIKNQRKYFDWVAEFLDLKEVRRF